MENSSQHRPTAGARSKRIVKWGSGLFAAFLAFAPPGTMILIFLLVWQFIGGNWVVISALLVLLSTALVLVLLRLRR